MAVIGADEVNRASITVNAVKVSISGATALSTVLVIGGTYYLTADTDCFVIMTGSNGTATTSATPLWAKTYLGPFKPTKDDTVANGGDAYVAGITTGASGSLYAIRVL